MFGFFVALLYYAIDKIRDITRIECVPSERRILYSSPSLALESATEQIGF